MQNELLTKQKVMQMKSVLLAKYHDVTEFASKDSSRYVINSVHYNKEKQCIEAVDGRIMVRVPVVCSEEFPPVKGQLETEPIDCIIPCPQFKKALANIPKESTIPALAHALLDCNGKVTLTTTDLDTEQSVTSKPIEGTYPNLDQVMPTEPPKLTIGMNARILKQIAEYALKHSCDPDTTVTLSFTEPLKPMSFSINVNTINGKVKAIGCAMPIRIA